MTGHDAARLCRQRRARLTLSRRMSGTGGYWRAWNWRAKHFAGGGAAAAPALPGFLLEDFRGTVLRNNNDTPPQPLWSTYNAGSTPQSQTGGLDAVNHNFFCTCNTMGSGASSGAYFHFLPFPYVWPTGFAQHFLLSGSPDFTRVNRLYFRIKRSADAATLAPGDTAQVGNYCKSHLDTTSSDQGAHFYWGLSPAWYAGEWVWVFVDRQCQHEVSEPGGINTPYDAENQSCFLILNVLGGAPQITATVTNGSPTVTFTGNMSGVISQSNVINFSQDAVGGPNPVAYTVKSIDSTTQLTLGSAGGGVTQNYLGPSNPGQVVSVVEPFPSSDDPNLVITKWPDASQKTVNFFDGLTRFYFDGSPFGNTPDTGVTYAADDYYFDITDEASEPIFQIAGSADHGLLGGPATVNTKAVSSVTTTWSPAANSGAGGYELSWKCAVNLPYNFKVAYKTTSMKAVGGGSAGWNSGAWDGATVAAPNSGYNGVLWTSPPPATMGVPARSLMYFGIQPVNNGTAMPNPSGYFTEVFYAPAP